MTEPISQRHVEVLNLSAYITVTDRTGTRITTPSLKDVVTLIARRAPNTPPIVGLDPVHYDDAYFQNATWQLQDSHFVIAPDELSDQVEYLLSYHDWHLTDEHGQTIPTAKHQPSQIGQRLANRSETTILLTSELPGVEPQEFHPILTEAEHEPSIPMTIEEDAMHNTPATETTSEATIIQAVPDTADDASQGTTESSQPQTRRAARQARASFLNPQQHDRPAEQGWRGALTQLGIRMRPSEKEQAERNDVHAVSQHWPGPRTIAVVNGKGGAGKTPTTILLSAIFARYGGGGVLAWDNNQTRGTLGWRTEQAGHDNTILELLPQADSLLGVGAQSADLAHFVHHQTSDRFDVLRSKPKVLADQQRFTQSDVDTIHEVSSKFFRLIIIDSGNDESDPLWRRMIDHTDQLVVATTTSDETAEGGALLLEDLASTGDHGSDLADNAVVVISQSVSDVPKSDLTNKVNSFKPLAREVVAIPYDPAMVDGSLTYEALRPCTQRAWLAAGAAVARGL